jgi:hypothetical protein
MSTNASITRNIIADKLQNDDKWLYRGIVAIYERQTADEQQAETTNHHNAKGFNGTDAKFGTSLAKQILAGRTLTVNQAQAARKMMRKYAGQLVKCAKEKAALTSTATA